MPVSTEQIGNGALDFYFGLSHGNNKRMAIFSRFLRPLPFFLPPESLLKILSPSNTSSMHLANMREGLAVLADKRMGEDKKRQMPRLW